MAEKTQNIVADMRKVLAKLHLAALNAVIDQMNDDSDKIDIAINQAIHTSSIETTKEHELTRFKKCFIINTGIMNDDPRRNPQDPGKVVFNLDNSSSTYELGYVKLVAIQTGLNAENIIQYLEKLAKDYDNLAEVAKNRNDGTNIKKAIVEELVSIDSKKEKKDIKNYDSEKIIDGTDSSHSNITDQLNSLLNSDQRKTTVEQITQAIQAANSKNNEVSTYDAIIDEEKRNAANILNGYMNVFVGENNFNKITENDVGAVVVSYNAKDSTYPGLVKNFEIQQIAQGEYTQFMSKYSSSTTEDRKQTTLLKVCFRVSYNLNIE